MSEEREERRITRRTIAKGAAWAVPAVPLVIATPAYAVSGSQPNGTIELACKQPGASCERDFGFLKGYTFDVIVNNPSNVDLWIYPTTTGTLDPYFDVTSEVPFTFTTAREYDSTTSTIGPLLPEAYLVPANGSVGIIVNAGTNSNSANTSATGVLAFAWGHSTTPGADPDHPYTPAPPSSPLGEGWFSIPFTFPSTPPCDNCTP